MKKKYSISSAGCTEEQASKLALCQQLFDTFPAKIEFKQWKGIDADLVIVNGDDSYGQKIASTSIRHGIHTLILSKQQEPIAGLEQAKFILDKVPASFIHKEIASLLFQDQEQATDKQSVIDEEKQTPLQNLMDALSATKKTSCFGFGNHHIFFDPLKGVCHVASRADLTVVLDAIRQGKEIWTKDCITKTERDKEEKMHLSIESFFFYALVKIKGHKFFLDKEVKLLGWPNINSSSYSAELASICASLISRPTLSNSLYEENNSSIVSSMLYAAHMSGLLEAKERDATQTKPIPKQPEQQKRTGLVGALGQWLGLR